MTVKQLAHSVDEVAGGTINGIPVGILAPMLIDALCIILMVLYAVYVIGYAHYTPELLRSDPIITTLAAIAIGHGLAGSAASITHMIAVRGPVARSLTPEVVRDLHVLGLGESSQGEVAAASDTSASAGAPTGGPHA